MLQENIPTTFIDGIYQNFDIAEAALQRCSWKKVFWKYTANLQGNTYAEVWF